MIYCPECGFHQSAANRFCVRCGARLEVEGHTSEATGPFAITDDQAEAGALAHVQPEGPALAVRAGGDGGPAGALFALGGPRVTVGRSPDSDIFLDDVTVSRNHAEIVAQGGGYALRDLGSLNGSYVNRRRIEGEARLADGDELQIGKFRLVFIAG